MISDKSRNGKEMKGIIYCKFKVLRHFGEFHSKSFLEPVHFGREEPLESEKLQNAPSRFLDVLDFFNN